MNNMTKPKLVFFQWKNNGIPKYLQLHRQQLLKCLTEFFSVFVLNDDCDYQEICDRYQPDLTLFESGVSAVNYSNRLKITNTSACTHIPKVGLYNGDAFCGERSIFISDMEYWDIEIFFSISVSLADYTPDIANNMFVFPNFIDSDIYRDYGESKIIPVLFTGSQASHYPWRQKISRIISQYHPSLKCPHFGWTDKKATSSMIYGEKYARMMNASWFVPACGTVCKEVVRKVFEVPGSKSCLITEKTPALEAAGFVDMENCVFADESDVLDKLDYLFKSPEEIERITSAGYQLVHSRHTLKQRNEIFQWFNLNKALKPGQRIVQINPFAPLTIVEEASGIKNSHISTNGLDRVFLHQGDEKLSQGQYDEAEALYFRCLNYVPYLTEAKLRLSLCNLYKGNVTEALNWIMPLIQHSREFSQSLDYDPVEWAVLIRSLLCQGKLNDAIQCVNQFPLLKHPELDRISWAVNILKNKEYKYTPLPSQELKYRASVHQLPKHNLNEWVDNLYIMLKVCQQFELAENLIKLTSPDNKYFESNQKNDQNIGLLIKYIMGIKSIFFAKIKISSISVILLKLKLTQILVRQKLKTQAGNFLRSLECSFGYFLPYHLSEKRNDEFFCAIQNLTSSEDIKTALVIGASAKEASTEAFLTGIQQNLNKPTVFCINIPLPQFVKLQNKSANNSVVKCYHFSSNEQENTSDAVDNIIRKIKQENKIDVFDIVLVDGSELNLPADLYNELKTVKNVILDDINIGFNKKNYYNLLAGRYHLIDKLNNDLRNGYAILKKI